MPDPRKFYFVKFDSGHGDSLEIDRGRRAFSIFRLAESDRRRRFYSIKIDLNSVPGLRKFSPRKFDSGYGESFTR